METTVCKQFRMDQRQKGTVTTIASTLAGSNQYLFTSSNWLGTKREREGENTSVKEMLCNRAINFSCKKKSEPKNQASKKLENM